MRGRILATAIFSHTAAHATALTRVLATALALGLLSGPVALADNLAALPAQDVATPWPTDRWPEAPLDPSIDTPDLYAAIDALFEPIGRGGHPDTRALLIVHHGRLVFERYAEGFGRETRFASWSAAKSFTQAFTGILLGEGSLALDAPAPVAAWQSEGDPRRAITLRQLLNMTSGIGNGDGIGNQGPDSFVAQLMFGEGATDLARFAAEQPLIETPGRVWAYSTGTSSILAAIVGNVAGEDRKSRSAFLRRALFDRLGMQSATFGFDAAGNFRGGSHLSAIARDYARFGLLYLRDGVWEGARLLPEGWVDFARSLAPAENNGTYGGHFWLNHEPKEGQFRLMPGGPPSAFAASGNGGQIVLIVPTHDLLLVRLGELQTMDWPLLNMTLADIGATFPITPGASP